jgi:MFS family permease
VYLHEARGFSLAVAQLPIVRARGSQPRRRAVARGRPLVVACLLALQGGFACLSAAATAFAVGECLHATAFMPLIADLAQLGLRGRYMATAGLSWWLGLAVAPTLGGPLLGMSASLPLIGGAVLAAAAIVLLRASEGALPVSARSIPQP